MTGLVGSRVRLMCSDQTNQTKRENKPETGSTGLNQREILQRNVAGLEKDILKFYQQQGGKETHELRIN